MSKNHCAAREAAFAKSPARFSAPIFPGKTIRLSFWRDGNAARMEARVPAHDTCVFADGRVVVEPDG